MLYTTLGGRAVDRVFKTIPEGRRYAANHFRRVPVLRTPQGVLFMPGDARHAAIARLENRHGTSHVVLVEPGKYWITRQKYGAEVSIKYRCTDETIFARNDHEDVS
jgi:hypothetical protein